MRRQHDEVRVTGARVESLKESGAINLPGEEPEREFRECYPVVDAPGPHWAIRLIELAEEEPHV